MNWLLHLPISLTTRWSELETVWVTYQRVTNHYQTIFDLSKEDYEKLTAPRISSNLQDTRDKLKLLQRNGEYYIGEMPNFSFYEFERDFITNNDLFKTRKKLKEPPPNQDQDGFDYSPYLRRFPIFRKIIPLPVAFPLFTSLISKFCYKRKESELPSVIKTLSILSKNSRGMCYLLTLPQVTCISMKIG
jgi:hypothetical protein